jgi:hypothetical protein
LFRADYLLRVDEGIDWKTYNPTTEMKALLLETRGEAESGHCIVAGCTKAPLNHLAFCIEHAFERGIRR